MDELDRIYSAIEGNASYADFKTAVKGSDPTVARRFIKLKDFRGGVE